VTDANQKYCLVESLDALDQTGRQLPPWAPGRREEAADVEHLGALEVKAWCMAEVDIFRDLTPAEMDAIAAAAPMKTYAAGELLFSPHNPVETLFILKRGRVRVFRVSVDGRALTTAIITPGTIFGEMVLLGQHMYDNYAEAIDETVVCVMSRSPRSSATGWSRWNAGSPTACSKASPSASPAPWQHWPHNNADTAWYTDHRSSR
jgi:hypothetical protein